MAVTNGVFSTSLFAADFFEYEGCKFQRYTETDGLISAETNGIYKDEKGFLWISTFNGLSRFDGRNFQNFGRESGLTESNLEVLGNDESGRLFVRSVSGVYCYTGNGAVPFFKYPTKGAFMAAACPTGNGLVWAAYEGQKGLHLFSATKELSSLPTNAQVYLMAKGSHGEIYVLEMDGKVSLLKNGKLQTIHRIQALRPYQNEGIWLYRDFRGRVWSYGANNGFLYTYNGSQIVDSLAVPVGTKWWQWSVGGASDAYLLSDSGSVSKLQNGCWKELFTKAQTRGFVYEVREDSDGTIWACTSSGLLRITRKQYDNRTALSPASYFAADSKGRYVLRSDSLLYTLPTAVNDFYALQKKDLVTVYVTRQKEVLYCTEDAVYSLPYGKSLQQLNTTKTYEGTKAAFRFRKILEDASGGLWIVSYHGIFYKKGDSLRYYYQREGITEGALYSIAIDAAGVVYTSGVNVFAFDGNRFQNISSQLHLPNELSRLATDVYGSVWVCQEGTNTVVKIGVAKDKKFYRADSIALLLNGLPFAATSAAFDGNNNLWLCDNRALYCHRYGNGGYHTSPLYFDERLFGSPLLYSDGANQLQVLSHPLAGDYLRTYSADDLLNAYRNEAPTVQLTAVRLFKQTFDWEKAGFSTDVLGVPQALRLSHNQNFLRFFFTGLIPDYSQNVAYRYRLVGYDDDWSPPTERGEAEYTGLPSGDYRFEAEARSAGGAWSKAIAYSFTVFPAWYRTWWAWCIWSLLAAGLIMFFLYLRSQSIKRKAHVQRLLVEEQMKALRAQINPHFLQNIFAFLAHELYAAQNTKAVKTVDRLSVYLRDVLRYSDKAAITLEEELDFAEEYLRMQQELLSVPFQYSINVTDEVDVFDVQVPSMLLQPLIENALKYGLSPQGENAIAIHVETATPYIRCTIEDSGNKSGTTAAPLQPGNGKGIALTKDRMALFMPTKNTRRNLTGTATPKAAAPLFY